MDVVVTACLGVLGLIVGSFLNALVWRLRKKRDWVKERSECTHCHHVLAPKDLIPVVSWVWLKGKCRYCRKKIDDSPLSELGLGLLFAVSYAFWPYVLQSVGDIALFVVWLVILAVFVVLCIYDFKWFLLPDKFTYTLIPLAIAFAGLRDIVGGTGFPAACLGAVVCFGLFYVLYQVSKGTWIGGGDVKLAFPLGLLAGSAGGSLALIFLSSLVGTVYALPFIARKKRLKNVQVPYGPFLILAAVLVVLFYDRLYNGLFMTVLFPL